MTTADALAPPPGDWLRGVLPLAVLRVVGDGPTYGYAIAAALEGHGLGEIRGGTLYPLLARLEASGDVTSQWRAGDGGPGRKYYEITASGRARLQVDGRSWARFADRVGRLVTSLDPDADRTTADTTAPSTAPTTDPVDAGRGAAT